jgi:ketosteroid isomerase-like protein
MDDTPEMALVREMYEASNRGDFDRTRDYFDPHVELIASGTHPDAGIYRGRDELLRWFANFYVTLFESWHVEILGMSQFGDAVVVEYHLQGKGQASGAEVSEEGAAVLTVRGGLIVRSQPQASLEDAIGVAKEEAARQT